MFSWLKLKELIRWKKIMRRVCLVKSKKKREENMRLDQKINGETYLKDEQGFESRDNYPK